MVNHLSLKLTKVTQLFFWRAHKKFEGKSNADSNKSCKVTGTACCN